MLKPLSDEKHLSPVEMGPTNGGFGGKWGSKPYILVSRPPKGTSLRGTASFYVFCVKICARVSALAFLKNHKKIGESLCAKGREIMHMQNRKPKTDLDKILRGGRYSRLSYLHKFWWPSVKGFFEGAGGQFSPSPIDFHRRPYNTLA